MPTYEYKCENGHQFEVVQRMADDALTACEVCEAPVQRVFHPIAVHFKGSGFYNTDYGTRRRSREAEANESKESSGSKGSENGAKPDAKKPETKPGSGSGSGSGKNESSKQSAAAAD